MSSQAIHTVARPSTSAEGAMGAPSSLGYPWTASLVPTTGTSARSLPVEFWEGGAVRPPFGTSGWVRTSRDREPPPLDTSAAVSELRRLSGLTWAQLGHLFGVARRSLHFWVSGRPIKPKNEERLRRLLAVLRRADRGSAQANRAMLLGDRAGVIPLDLLIAGKYEAFLALVGEGRGRRPMATAALSREALAARQPPRPAELVDALQDRVHRDLGRARAARTVRSKQRGRDR